MPDEKEKKEAKKSPATDVVAEMTPRELHEQSEFDDPLWKDSKIEDEDLHPQPAHGSDTKQEPSDETVSATTLATPSLEDQEASEVEEVELEEDRLEITAPGDGGGGDGDDFDDEEDDDDDEYDDSDEDDEEENEDETSMTLVEHLAELRDRLIRCVAYVAVTFVVSIFVCKDIMRFLQAPAGEIQFQALSMEEPLLVFIKVAFYAALILASPLILFELSQFIGPGLTRKEKQIVAPALIGGPLLFVLGAAFAYYCLLPPMLHFFNSFGQGVTPIHQRLDFYMSLVSSVLLYMGLAFQLPIVLFALSFTGLVNSDQLIKFWRYAVFGTSVIALVITPDPTAFSMILVMGALMGLYAITVVLLKLFGR